MKKYRFLTTGTCAVLIAAGAWHFSKRFVPAPKTPAAGAAQAHNSANVPAGPAPATVATSVATAAFPAPAAPAPKSPFHQWLEDYQSGSPAVSSADGMLLGVQLAAERKARMVALMKSNPEQAIQESLPYSLRKNLPPAIAALVEQQIDARGDYLVLGATPAPGSDVPVRAIRRYAEVASQMYEAYTYGERLQQITTYDTPLNGIAFPAEVNERGIKRPGIMALQPGARVLARDEVADLITAGLAQAEAFCSVSGLPSTAVDDQTWASVGDEIVNLCRKSHAFLLTERLMAAGRAPRVLAEGEDGYPTNPPPDTVVTFTQGRRTVLLIRLAFPDDPRSPSSDSSATRVMNDVNRFFVECSYNTTTLIPTITPVLVLPQTKRWYADAGEFALLSDARTVAHQAGFPFREYDLDVVAHTSVPNFDWGGLAFVGARGAWLQSVGAGVASHELGHNFGLLHANFWETIKPEGPPNPNAPGPNFPTDSDSFIGHDAVISPGRDVEYGDPFDTMGSAGAGIFQFNAVHKYILNWLDDRFVRTIRTSETNRLFAFDSPDVTAGQYYALRIRKDYQREYWVDFRQRWVNNPWQSQGVELHWGPWLGTIGTAQLVDTTPGSSALKDDAAVVIGRTYSDPEANLFITPIAKGGTERQWVDVVVHMGVFPTNVPPVVTLTASELMVTNGATVDFSAVANDANGDRLAYYWTYSDNTFGPNAPQVSKTFNAVGNYTVHCQVSDMKGGVTTRYVVVRVGEPATFTMSGQVIDTLGNPVEGMRMHNGVSGGGYRYTYTDSDGNYTITGLASSNYNNRGFLYGYNTSPLDFFNPVVITAADASSLNHLAVPITKVTVTANTDVNEATAANSFTVTRTGDTSADLAVYYVLSGSAQASVHYAPIEGNTILIPAGSASADLVVDATENDLGDGDQFLTMTLRHQTNDLRITSVITNTGSNTIVITVTNRITFPGWELQTVNQERIWFQTYPFYVFGNAEATIRVIDNDPPMLPSVSATFSDDAAVETGDDNASVLISRFGNTAGDLVVHYTMSGQAVNGEDYHFLSGSITIPADQQYVLLPIIAKNDLFVEGNESIVLTITPDAAYTVATSSDDGLIVDDDLPLVTVNSTDNIAAEPAANIGSFTISRSGDLSASLVVGYLVTGTATSGADFQTLSGSVTIPSGQISATVDVVPISDTLTENFETVVLFISDSPVYNIGSPSSAQVTIQDDELPTISLAVTDATAAEPSDNGALLLTRTGPTNVSLTVNLIVAGTAVPGSDYSAIGTNLFLPAGVSSSVITVSIVNDLFRETNETVIVQLGAGTAYNLGTSLGGVITIGNNDHSALPEVSFLTAKSSVSEGYGIAQVGIGLSHNPETNNNHAPVIVEYRVMGGSATRGVDYTLMATGYAVFAHLGPLSTNIIIQLQNDDTIEPVESIIITLFDPDLIVTNRVVSNMMTNLVPARVPTNAYLGAFRTHTLSIIDDDVNVVSVEATSNLARESGPTPSAFRFTRTGSLAAPLTAYFAVTGTADSPTDFQPLGQSVLFPAGSNVVVVPMIPVDDSVEEYVETVHVTLTSVPGGRVGGGFANINIQDNDGTIQFVTSAYHVAENAGPAFIEVRRSGDTNLSVAVDYVLSDGTASGGVDYQTGNGRLTFEPGVTSQNIIIPFFDDSVVEPAETISLALTNPTGGLPLGGQRTSTLFIDNDDSAFQFSTNTFAVAENRAEALLTIERIGVTTPAGEVRLITTNLTATSGVDYFNTNVVIHFNAGETSKVVALPLVDDASFEGDETVALVLGDASAPNGLGTNNPATLVIVDDESILLFIPPTANVEEYAGEVVVEVRRLGGTINPVSVGFFTLSGLASNDVDFVSQTGTVNFRGDEYVLRSDGSGILELRPGETNQFIRIGIVDDIVGEGNEKFYLVLTNATGPETGVVAGSTQIGSSNHTASITIFDNELPGSVDYEFNTSLGANERVLAVSLQSDQRLVIGGEFTVVAGVAMPRVARLRADGVLDTSFNPGAGINEAVHAVVSQPDNKVLVGGAFSTVDTTNRSGVARLNADGSLDLTFNPGAGANNVVRALALQTNGQVIVGGDFLVFNGAAHSRVVRLNTDGTVDPGFAPSFDNQVFALAVQADGKIIAGGAFNSVNGVSRAGIVRLLTNGMTDVTFNPGSGASSPVNAVVVQADGRILVGGRFTAFNEQLANYIIRLNSDGTTDTGFDVGQGANAPVNALAVHPGGKIIVGGSFTAFDGNERNRFVRLKSDGSLDFLFDVGTGANNNVRAVAVQPNTAVIIGGEFTEVDGLQRNRIARIHGDELSNIVGVEFSRATYTAAEDIGKATITVTRSGNTNASFSVDVATADETALVDSDYESVDETLTFGPGQITQTFLVTIINDALVEPTESLLLQLRNIPSNVELTGPSTSRLVIVDNEKSLQFSAGAYTGTEGSNVTITVVRFGANTSSVSVTLSTASGTATNGVDFVGTTQTLNFGPTETSKEVVIQLTEDEVNEVDETFTVILSNPVGDVQLGVATATVTIEDNEPGVGGLIVSFVPGRGANNLVRSVSVDEEGKVYVGGAFTVFDGTNRNYITRLNANGSHDLTFNPGSGASAFVSSVVALPEGQVALGGAFTNVNGVAYNRVARLLGNGSADLNFNQLLTFDGSINSLTLVPETGRLMVGGGFSQPTRALAQLRPAGTVDSFFNIGAGANAPVHAIEVQSDGLFVVGGAFTAINGVSRSRLARIHPSGLLDAGFNPTAIGDGTIYTIALRGDGKMIVGGYFSLLGQTNRIGVVRLNADGSLDPTFATDSVLNSTVFAAGLQIDDKVIIGGDFTTVDGTNRNRYARLLANGNVDIGFDPGSGANNTVFDVNVLPNQNVIIAGDFNVVDGQLRGGVAMIKADDNENIVISIQLVGGTARIVLNSVEGHSYMLEATDDMGSWVEVETKTATGLTLELTDSNVNASTQRFYRVRRTDP